MCEDSKNSEKHWKTTSPGGRSPKDSVQPRHLRNAHGALNPPVGWVHLNRNARCTMLIVYVHAYLPRPISGPITAHINRAIEPHIHKQSPLSYLLSTKYICNFRANFSVSLLNVVKITIKKHQYKKTIHYTVYCFLMILYFTSVSSVLFKICTR